MSIATHKKAIALNRNGQRTKDMHGQLDDRLQSQYLNGWCLDHDCVCAGSDKLVEESGQGRLEKRALAADRVVEAHSSTACSTCTGRAMGKRWWPDHTGSQMILRSSSLIQGCQGLLADQRLVVLPIRQVSASQPMMVRRASRSSTLPSAGRKRQLVSRAML